VSLPRVLLAVALLGPALVSPVAAAQGGADPSGFRARSGATVELTDPVSTKALAVALTQDGERTGLAADLSVTVAENGSGHVFVDTRPLAGTDMQGSARMAARVAASVTGYAMADHDFFFVMRSDSPTISGPSAGSTMALASVVALQNAHLDEDEEAWNLTGEVLASGTISPDGTIGPVGGLPEKAEAARDSGAGFFAVPPGQGTFQPRPAGPNQERPDPVNMTTYCEEELSITCREVASIEQLVELATGHRLTQEPTGEDPSTAEYEETLAPLSADLVDNASAYRDAWTELNSSDLRPEARATVQDAIQQAHDAYQQAVQLRADDRYYSAASRAFLSSIHGTHAEMLLEYLNRGRSLDYVEQRIDAAADRADEARSAAGNATVEGMHDVYTVGAAQERVSEAERRVDSARGNLDERNVPQALFDTAWAMERSKTVHWWLELGEAFGDGPPLPSDVAKLSEDVLELADEILAYARETLQAPADRASQTLQSAKQDDQRGFHAAALIQAAEAQVQAALATELRVGEPSPEKVQTSREQAVEAIERARERGVEPMLAVAMFEFGGDQDQPARALEQYRTARTMAGLSSVLSGESDPRPSNYVGAWEGGTHGGPSEPATPEARAWAVGWFIVGMFTTIALVAFAAGLVQRGD